MTTPHFVTKDPSCGIILDGVTAPNGTGGPTISAVLHALRTLSPRRTDQPRKPRRLIIVNTPHAIHVLTMTRAMCPLGRLGISLILALVSSAPAVLLAAELPNERLTTEPTLTDHCYDLRAQRQLLHADVAAQNANLAGRISTMNSAGEGQKIDLISALITQMVGQKTVMDERKDKMEERVIRHLMEHMRAQKSIDGNSIALCPLTNGLKVTNDPISNDHNEPREPAPR